MELINVLLITGAISFFSVGSYRFGHTRGYRKGARQVLGEWKQFMNLDDIDDQTK